MSGLRRGQGLAAVDQAVHLGVGGLRQADFRHRHADICSVMSNPGSQKAFTSFLA
jgi:hypothetical protein